MGLEEVFAVVAVPPAFLPQTAPYREAFSILVGLCYEHLVEFMEESKRVKTFLSMVPRDFAHSCRPTLSV